MLSGEVFCFLFSPFWFFSLFPSLISLPAIPHSSYPPPPNSYCLNVLLKSFNLLQVIALFPAWVIAAASNSLCSSLDKALTDLWQNERSSLQYDLSQPFLLQRLPLPTFILHKSHVWLFPNITTKFNNVLVSMFELGEWYNWAYFSHCNYKFLFILLQVFLPSDCHPDKIAPSSSVLEHMEFWILGIWGKVLLDMGALVERNG